MTRLSVCVGLVILACGLPPAFGGARAATESTVHFLGKGTDGAQPYVGLVYVGGAFYGTTYNGGTHNGGTVFKIAADGTETVLHSFGGSTTDGTYPRGSLVSVGGALYGTTVGGGKHNKGTVFKITPAGSESVIHAFAGQPKDGETPDAPLIAVGGTLYGTTENGGTKDLGTAYSIGTGGGLNVLHSFGTKPNNKDGALPEAGLLEYKGLLYGTTYQGGSASDKGTIFSMTTGGAVNILHVFGVTAGDGSSPQAGLMAANGVLYGTTPLGGSGPYAAGTVYSLTGGTVKVLHTFTAFPLGDGTAPTAPLTLFNGVLYGTTSAGGAYQYGTVFKITPKGAETIVHSFNSKPEGAYPFGNVIGVGKALYGTLLDGGPYNFGAVFKLVP